MKKRLSKILAIFLTLSLCLSVSMITAFAVDNNATESSEHSPYSYTEEQKAAFDALPDDAIVCYMHGQPVYKYEVDEHGMVHKDFSLPVTRASAMTDTLPSIHRYETITAGCNLVTTGFSQNELVLYLSEADARKVINGLDQGWSAVSIASDIAVGAGTFYSQLVGILGYVVAANIEAVMNQISNCLSSGNLVELDVVSSRYGQFVSVYNWSGTTCIRYSTSQNGVTITVTGAYCKNHNTSVWA